MAANRQTAVSPQRSTHDSGHVKIILQDIALQGQRLEHGEPGSREALLSHAQALVAALESPTEIMYAYMLAEPTRLVAGRVALDLKLFETLAVDQGRPKSVTELAAPCQASPKLVRRIIRHLAAMKMVDQTDDDEYCQNRMSRLLAFPKYREGICYCLDAVGPTLGKMPEYLLQTKHANPENSEDGPFQYAFDTPSHWIWLEQHPRVMQAFQDYLTGVREDRPNFMDPGFYPVDERLVSGLKLQGTSPEDAACSAFVDVGGGTGHALAEFHSKVPSWNGRLVLQEQGPVVQLAKSEPHASLIEAEAHDFLTPQPLKGARAYYMRYILHDWPDRDCRTILQHLRDAMTPGYSKLLIHECVVADRDASWQHTSLDLYMMALFATQERTESEWRDLLDSVGLRITGIWTKGAGNLSLIEAML